MRDSRFEGVTLHVGWWPARAPEAPLSYVLRLDPLTHPTEWVGIAADFAAPGTHIWCNQPLVADAIPFDRVRVWSKSGKSKLLSEHPDAAKWIGLLKAGELWSYVGEAWVDEPSGVALPPPEGAA